MLRRSESADTISRRSSSEVNLPLLRTVEEGGLVENARPVRLPY